MTQEFFVVTLLSSLLNGKNMWMIAADDKRGVNEEWGGKKEEKREVGLERWDENK